MSCVSPVANSITHKLPWPRLSDRYAISRSSGLGVSICTCSRLMSDSHFGHILRGISRSTGNFPNVEPHVPAAHQNAALPVDVWVLVAPIPQRSLLGCLPSGEIVHRCMVRQVEDGASAGRTINQTRTVREPRKPARQRFMSAVTLPHLTTPGRDDVLISSARF